MIPRQQYLLEMLSNNDVTFFIPPYQRNYEWTEEQCKIFVEDVKNTYANNIKGERAEHFFGSITYFRGRSNAFGEPSKLVLIDGQQRITTTMLFLAAVRDVAGGESVIENRFLINERVHGGDNENKIKLKQVEADWEAYKKIIFSEDLADREKKSCVYKNYKYFCDVLRKCGADKFGFIQNGLAKFSIVSIELEPEHNSWENPQEIFESMNSLGKPLSLADLVRNYLLLGMDADRQNVLYTKYWLNIEHQLSGIVELSKFVRDYMQGKYKCSYPTASEMNFKKLYNLFKKNFSYYNAEELLKELSLNAGIYRVIISGTDSGNEEIDKELKDLLALNVTTVYSFLLELFRAWKIDNKFTSQDIYGILHAFKIYCLRRRLAKVALAENKNFPLLVKYIETLSKSSNKSEKMFEILANQEYNLRVPNDDELTRILKEDNFYNFRYNKFIFSLIEEKLTKCRPNQCDKNLQIEHIMPQSLNDNWKRELGEDFEAIHFKYVHNIGNLTLIRHNQELSNKSFEDKKKIYDNNAGLQIARSEITDKNKWDDESIENRMGWIIKFLLTDVLPIPDIMRRANNFRDKEKVRRKFSFEDVGLLGKIITFIDAPSITAKVIDSKHVEYQGKRYKLAPLTREIKEQLGTANPSGSYQGSQFWTYNGKKLIGLSRIVEEDGVR